MPVPQLSAVHQSAWMLPVRLGKNELPMAVEWNMDELHPGGMARMYAPWYTAFGQQGTAHIPPYENVMIEIELR